MTNKKPQWPNNMNDTNTDIVIVVIVERWNYTKFEQQLLWPKNTMLSSVLNDYQTKVLGSRRYYRIIDYYILQTNGNKVNKL